MPVRGLLASPGPWASPAEWSDIRPFGPPGGGGHDHVFRGPGCSVNSPGRRPWPVSGCYSSAPGACDPSGGCHRADIIAAGFDLLTWRKGTAPDVPAAEFTTISCADDRGREHQYDLADTTVTLDINDGPRKGETVSLRQVTRRVPARGGTVRQIHALTTRKDLQAGEVCWRLTSRWREENYFRYARTRFALDALDSYSTTPDDPDCMIPNPAKKAASAQVRRAEALAAAAEAGRDAALLELRNPGPGQAALITNQMLNALSASVETAYTELDEAERSAAAVPPRIRLGDLAPDMIRLEAEVKQITHAIRMAAYNAETTLARALHGRYARAGDEAYALIREALTASGDIIPRGGQLLVRLDPLTARQVLERVHPEAVDVEGTDDLGVGRDQRIAHRKAVAVLVDGVQLLEVVEVPDRARGHALAREVLAVLQRRRPDDRVRIRIWRRLGPFRVRIPLRVPPLDRVRHRRESGRCRTARIGEHITRVIEDDVQDHIDLVRVGGVDQIAELLAT
jgi:Transposase protein